MDECTMTSETTTTGAATTRPASTDHSAIRSSSPLPIAMMMLPPNLSRSHSSHTDPSQQQQQHNYTEEGLIAPKKLINPCLESRERIDLHRELKFNVRAGINVLDQKSELTKALEKRAAAAKQKEREESERLLKLQRKSSFERKLEEQAVKIMNSENEAKNTDDHNHNNTSKGTEDEFLRIHAKIYEKKQHLASSTS